MYYNIAVLISGLSIVISIFLLDVTRRVSKRRRVRILSFMSAVFVLILLSNVVFVVLTFTIFPTTGIETTFLLAVQLVILLLFYAGIVRGL